MKTINSNKKKAVALKYEEYVPTVIASGKGEIARKIIDKAEEFDISIFKNETLVNSLLNIDINVDIPPQLYQAVAEVFVWLQKTEQKSAINKY